MTQAQGPAASASKLPSQRSRLTLDAGTFATSATIGGGIRVASAGITVLATLFFARVLGPHDYGIYAYVATCAALLAIPTGLGFSQYLVREAARSATPPRELLRWADHRVAIAGTLASLLMVAAALLPQAADAQPLFLCAAPLPFLTSLAANRQAVLQARGEYVASQWPQLLLMPTILLGLFAATRLVTSAGSPLLLMGLTVASAITIVPAYSRLVRRGCGQTQEAGTAHLGVRKSLPFMWLGLVYLANGRIDLLMLGALQGAHSAGTYAVASRAAELSNLLLILAGGILAPRFAMLHQRKRWAGLQRLVSGVTRGITAITVPAAAALFVWAEPILAFLFGAEYAEAANPLRILLVGQVFNVATGPSGILLNMTGHERLTALSIGAGVLANVVLGLVLIPRYDALGAALATTASIVAWNVMLSCFARSRLGIRTTVLARPGRPGAG